VRPSRSRPQRRHVVERDLRIACDENELLDLCLSYQHAVERVAVVAGKSSGGPSVVERDAQLIVGWVASRVQNLLQAVLEWE
jgi:hypothetical protein